MRRAAVVLLIVILVMAFILVNSGPLLAEKGLPEGVLQSSSKEEVTPVLASVLAEPAVAVLSDGRFYLNYELMLTNVWPVDITLQNLEIVAPDRDNKQIALFNRESIEPMLRLPGAAGPTTTLGPAQFGIVKINLSFGTWEEIPVTIEHLLTVVMEKPLGPFTETEIIERLAQTSVGTETGPVIGPPLKGDRWIACVVGGYGYHRNTVMPLNGRLVAAERWAVDWVQMDENNRLVTGDPLKVESYPQYGQEVIAVADGTVLSVKNDMPNEVPGKMPEGVTIYTAAGNFVLQDIGDGYSAFYAHFVPGSLRVKEGDKVRRGQVLGLLGNSGNTDAPHLHFHVIKGTLCLASDGVPYVIDSFKLKGYAESDDYLLSRLESGEPVEVQSSGGSGERSHEMPADVAVVEFSQ